LDIGVTIIIHSALEQSPSVGLLLNVSLTKFFFSLGVADCTTRTPNGACKITDKNSNKKQMHAVQ
jgi:hypothetical protein